MSVLTLPLDAQVSGRLALLLAEQSLLSELVDALGSPCNVIVPEQIAANVEAFRGVYRNHHLTGSIYFAHKANRSAAILRHLAVTDAGVDVASLAELQHALGAGFNPDRIVATGPKSTPFLWLSALTGITVSVDSAGELHRLAAIVNKHGLSPVPVSVRLSGFSGGGVTVLSRTSRFGTPVSELGTLLDALDRHRDAVRLVGLAYHLDTIGAAEKAVALDSCFAALEPVRARGHTPQSIDIGGGFGVNYLASADQWESWTSALTASVLGHGPQITWSGHGYGLRAEHGKLRGALGLYPAYRPTAGAAYLDELLSLNSEAHERPFGTTLLETMLDLDIEPGRALLDQCGMVLARVLEVRDTPDRRLVVVEANARDISLEEHGVVMDPIVVPGDGRTLATETDGVHLLGNLCLEADLLTRRTVWLPRCLRAGDLFAFANTAGYFMDFSADHALQQPVATTVAAHQIDGRWAWCLDDQYWPSRTTEAAR
jgi:diaminopimelate decarboxylase